MQPHSLFRTGRRQAGRGCASICQLGVNFLAPWARHICRVEIKNGSSSVGAKSAAEDAAPTELWFWVARGLQRCRAYSAGRGAFDFFGQG